MTTPTPALLRAIDYQLQGLAPGELKSAHPLPGGDSNAVYLLRYTRAAWVVKINDAGRFPQMFQAEKQGLTLLAKASTFVTPTVRWVGQVDSHALIVMDYLPSGSEKPVFWSRFGESLAQLHRYTKATFGLDHPNYIGVLSQNNQPLGTWTEFYAQRRILPLFEQARDEGYFSKEDSEALDRLLKQLPELIPPEPPSLLHGDLWNGNYLVTEHSSPALIDPAVYFGHREMDWGMMCLFGNFAERLYPAYQTHYPLQPGWRSRLPLMQLYPLLVHVLLFGGSYVSSVRAVLRRYT